MSIEGLSGDALQQALAQDALDRAMHPPNLVKEQEAVLRKVMADCLAANEKMQADSEARLEQLRQKEVARVVADQRKARRLGVASMLLAAQPLGPADCPARDAEEIRRVLEKADALLAAIE